MGCHAEPKVKHLACASQILRFAQNDMYHFICHRALRLCDMIFPCFRLGLSLKSAIMKKASPIYVCRASIVSIGNELLSGQTVDTNAAYLSNRLLSINIPVVSVYTIGDDKDTIIRAFNLACSDADVVIATGGLGPTDDDLTRQAFAEFLGVELQLQDQLL